MRAPTRFNQIDLYRKAGKAGKPLYGKTRQIKHRPVTTAQLSPVGHAFKELSGPIADYITGEREKKRAAAAQADMRAVLTGGNAQPWRDPDTGEVDPKQAPTGGYAGMAAALRGIDNPDLANMEQQVAMGQMQQREAAQLAATTLEAKTLAQIRVKQAGSGKDGKGETWGKTPVWGKDATGNPVLGVVSDKGNFKSLDTGSFNPERQGLQKVDAGDHWAFIDSRGQVVSTQKKRLTPGEEPAVRGRQAAQAAGGTVEGKTGAQARIDLPKLKNSATEILGLLDKIETHPGLSGVVGMPSLVGAVGGLRGTAEGDFNVLLDQVKGKQFMEAYQSLKGGGVITEVEGEKATDALARMNTAQTEEAFKDGLKDFRDVVNRGLIIAEDRARIGLDTTKQPAAVARATKRIKFDAKGNIIP
jgi:hypothetical protein